MINNHTAHGSGLYACDSGTYYDYTVRLTNRSGNGLAQRSGGWSAGGTFHLTADVGCSGAYVHSWAYMNLNGAGSSDTSGENLC